MYIPVSIQNAIRINSASKFNQSHHSTLPQHIDNPILNPILTQFPSHKQTPPSHKRANKVITIPVSRPSPDDLACLTPLHDVEITLKHPSKFPKLDSPHSSRALPPIPIPPSTLFHHPFLSLKIQKPNQLPSSLAPNIPIRFLTLPLTPNS